MLKRLLFAFWSTSIFLLILISTIIALVNPDTRRSLFSKAAVVIATPKPQGLKYECIPGLQNRYRGLYWIGTPLAREYEVGICNETRTVCEVTRIPSRECSYLYPTNGTFGGGNNCYVPFYIAKPTELTSWWVIANMEGVKASSVGPSFRCQSLPTPTVTPIPTRVPTVTRPTGLILR